MVCKRESLVGIVCVLFLISGLATKVSGTLRIRDDFECQRRYQVTFFIQCTYFQESTILIAVNSNAM